MKGKKQLKSYLLLALFVFLLFAGVALLSSRQRKSAWNAERSIVNQSIEPGQFSDKELGIHFTYPKEWGDLKLENSDQEQTKSDEIFFTTGSPQIPMVCYHIASEKILFVENGQKVSGTLDGSTKPQQSLKLLMPNGQSKNIYTIPLADVKNHGSFRWLHFSPQGNYAEVQLIFWEWSNTLIFDLNSTQKLGLPPSPGDIQWSTDEKTLVLVTTVDAFSGEGEDALFVSHTGSPQDLRMVFSRGSKYLPKNSAKDSQGTNGLDFSDIRIDSTKMVHFHVKLCSTSYCSDESGVDLYNGNFVYDALKNTLRPN